MSEKKQDITQLRQRLAHSSIIVDATRRFTSTLDSDEIQLALFEAVFQVVGAQQIALHLIGEKELQSYICHPLENYRTETAVLPPGAAAFCVYEETRLVIWNHDDDEPTDPPVCVEAAGQFNSYLALPLKGADKVVGVIEAFNLLEPQNSAQQAALLTEIAGPASLAIYNGMLYQEAQREIAERKRIELEVRQKEMKLARRAAQLETVSRVSAHTSTILETDKLLQEVVNLTKEQFELYHVHIYLVNAAGDTLDLVAGAGEVGRQMVAQGRPIPLQQKQSLVAQVARSGHGLIENDVVNNPAFLPHPLLPETRSEAAVPVVLDGRVIGVLDVQSDQVGTFTEQDVFVYTILAGHIAIALENARSYEHTRTSLTETEALLDITKETNRVLELANTAEIVLDKVLAAVNFDAGVLTIVDPDTQTLKISSHRLPEPFLQVLEENGLDGTLCDLVYRRQESVTVTDMTVDAPVDVTGLLDLGFRSYQGVPLESRGEVLGTLCIFSRQPLDPEKANSVFLQAIGQQVGIAIRNAALFEQAQTALLEAEQSQQSVEEYLDMQRVLHELNIELFGIDDLDELYQRSVELARTRLGFERIGMYLLNESKDTLLGTYGTDVEGNICSEQGPEYDIAQRETIDTFVLNRTRLVVEEDVDLWYRGEVVGRGWHIGAAMWVQDSPIGVIFVDNLVAGQPLRPHQAELLFAYAGIVANLIQRNRFETIITKRATEMQAVAEVSTAAATILDTDKLLQEVVDLTKNSFDLYHAHIYLLDKETEMLVLTSGAGTVGQQMVAEGREIPLHQEQSLVARAARSRQGVVINDVQAEPGFLPHPLLPDTRAEMAVPLVTGDRVLGVLDVQSDRLNYFTKEDINTFSTLATQTAVALQNAGLFTESEERAKELAFVNRIVTELNVVDPKTGLQFMAEELGEILQIPSIVIGLIDDTGTVLEITAAHHPAEFPSPVGAVFPVARDPIMSQALQARQTVAVQDVANANLLPEAREAILKTGTRSMYVIPMIVGRDLIGTVSLSFTEGGSLLTPGQLKLAETTVYQAATAVQNARLFGQVQTAFRNAEQSQADLSQALKIAKLAYWEYNVEKDLFTFNDQFYSLFHTTAEQHGGYQLSSAYYAQHFVHPDDLHMVGGEIERGLNSTDRHYNHSLEHRILYADGGVGYISVNINIDRDEEGNILRNYGANQDITERKRAEEILRRSEADLSEALKIAKLAYWEYDAEKDLFTFNDQFYALFHTTAEQHGGYQLSSAYYAQHFVYPDDLPMVGGEIERSLNSTDRQYNRLLEHRVLYADGGVGYISVNINLERDEDGKILRLYGANQDITERKRAEESLRRNEAELSEALKIAKLAYWEYDVENDLFTFNDQFFALFHTTAEEHGGYQLPSAYYAEHFVYPDDLPIVGAEIERALNSTDRYYSRSLEHRIRYADGGVGHISVSINIDRDEQGKILRYYGANQDITERKLFEEALQKERERVQVILESINVPFAVTRMADGKVIYCNEALGDLVGVPHEKLIGQGMPDFYANPSDREAYISQLREQGFVNSFDLHMKRADSQQYWALLSGRLIEFQGEPAIITFALDITERREAQALIAQRAAELQTVAELGNIATTILEPDKLLQQVVDLTKERFEFYHAQIYLLNAQQDTLVLAFGAGDVGHQLVAQKHQIGLNVPQSLVAQAARSGQAVVVNNVRGNPNWLPNELLPETQAEMAVPMMVGNRVVGVLDVQANERDRFTNQDMQIQTALAAQVSIALENARSFEQAQTAVAEMNALTRRLTREGWQDYLDQAASEGVGYIFDSSGSDLLRPISDATSEAVFWLEDGNGSQPAKPLIQPIAIHGETIGQLVIMPEDDEDEVDAEIAEIIRSVIEQLGARIENLRLTDQTQMALAETEEQAQRLARLNEMGAALNHATSLIDVYNIAVTETPKVLAVDQTSLALLSEAGDHFEITAVWGDAADLPVGTRLLVNEAPMLPAVQENRIGRGAVEGAAASALYVPLTVGDKVIGTLNVGHKEARTYKASDENLLRQVATLISSNIENMRFLTNEQARAQREQVLRQITQRIRSSADVETIMRTAVQEIGRTLGRKTYIYLGEDHEA